MEFLYPFNDYNFLLNKKKYKRELTEKNNGNIKIKIAILTGATVDHIKDLIEIFLLSYGITVEFYVSDYNRYYEEAVFENEKLKQFNPDIIYIFTTFRNINVDLNINMTKSDIDEILKEEFLKYVTIWESLKNKYNKIILQNNFEMPNFRLLGNKDIYSEYGLSNFIFRLNEKIYEYANNKNIYIVDINYIAADYGLKKWHNEKLYALYKLPFDIDAMPYVSHNVSNIIKSIYGKNKKAICIDFDNTIWGGVAGDDISSLTVGKDSGVGELYYDFQNYIKKLKSIGVVLNAVTKNDEGVALSALENTDGVLKKDDFLYIESNWNRKDENIIEISKKMNINEDSIVFIDDNPMERDLVKTNIEKVSTPKINAVEEYINTIDRQGYFEVTNLTKEDVKKNEDYKNNIKRENEKKNFIKYEDYLDSLNMEAHILPFEKKYYERISQLSNKSNQFNLTTKRYTVSDIENISNDEKYITLYGNLFDKFGDNGIVSLIIGKVLNDEVDIELFLMSCRVLKRDMEYAMFDKFVNICKNKNIKRIIGKYIKTEKNDMVKELYKDLGLKCIEKNETYTVWEIEDINKYVNKNHHIKEV